MINKQIQRLALLPERIFRSLRKNKKIIPLLTPFGKLLTPQRWIFIIGCYNSGTTLLDHILQAHPDIQGLPNEGVRLTDSLPRPEEFGWNRMWHKCYKQMSIDKENAEKISQRIKRQWSFWYNDESQNYLEKSIANAVRIPFLDKYFQPAYFIYIVRNGYVVAEGIQRKSKPGKWGNKQYHESYPIECCARQWQFSDQVVARKSEGIKNFLTITYETFTERPVDTMNEITSFLNLSPMDRDIIEGEWQVHGYNSPIKNMNDKSFARLTREDKAIITHIAGKTLKKYDYTFSK